jgi:hypothetical protein
MKWKINETRYMKIDCKYSRLIPSIFRGTEDETSFIERYLKIFEEIIDIVILNEISGMYLFSWNEIPGNDSDILIDFLKQNYSIDWLRTAKTEKINNEKTIRVTDGKNHLSLNLNNDNTRVNLTIDNDRTDEFIVKIESGKLNIYRKSQINKLDIISGIFHPDFIFLFELFCWDEVPGTDNLRLIQYLSNRLKIDPKKNIKIEKNNDDDLINVFYDKYLFNWDEISGKDNQKLIDYLYLTYKFDWIKKAKSGHDKYLFDWNEITEKDKDKQKFLEILKQEFGFNWIKNATIREINDSGTIKLTDEKNTLTLTLNNEKTKVKIKIDNLRTYELIARIDHGKLKIFSNRSFRVSSENNSISLILNANKSIINLKIHDIISDELIAKMENGKLNIYKKVIIGLELDNEKDEVRFTINDYNTINDRLSAKIKNGKRNIYFFKKKDFIPYLEEEQNIKFTNYFNTGLDEFLVWFAQWMGLVLKANWDIETKRKLIAKIILLYRMRGTKNGLEEYLKICTGYDAEIIDEMNFQVGITSTVGKDTRIGGLPPYHFIVNIYIPGSDPGIPINRAMIEELINNEKPVHTTLAKLNIFFI